MHKPERLANQTESAILAGCLPAVAPNQGSRMEKRPEIRERVVDLKSVFMDSTEVEAMNYDGDDDVPTRSWIVTGLIEIARIGLARNPQQPGRPPLYDLPSVNRALETLAKMGGYLVKESYSHRESLNLSMITDQAQLQSALRKQVVELPTAERMKLLQEVSPDQVTLLNESDAN